MVAPSETPGRSAKVQPAKLRGDGGPASETGRKGKRRRRKKSEREREGS